MSGTRKITAQKNNCHPERSEESRMVTLDVLFTGSFTAARFRMTVYL